ncbi:MAG: hypothetical protein HGB10_05705 [Coriobacteriia bacterium]|nr:hypothetical protein [Coriobacteriia bacterium]
MLRLKSMVLVALLAGAVVVSGCSVKQSIDEKLAPEPTQVTVEATVAAVGAPIDGTLKPGFPDTLPMWPGAKVAAGKTTKTPQGKSYSATLTTTDPYADVLAGVGEGLKRAGWTVEAMDVGTPEQQATILSASSDSADGIITVSQLPKKPVRIEYVITPKK